MSNQRLRKWTSSIVSGQIKGLEEEIKDAIIDYSCPKNSLEVQKMIIQLCHYSIKCEKENVSKAQEIFRLANTICSKIKILSDCSKFFASVYHILKILLSMNLYTEAKALTAFVSEGSYWHEQTSDRDKMYTKLENLWRSAIWNYIRSLNPRKIEMDSEELIFLLQFHLRLKLMSSNDGSRCILRSIQDNISLLKERELRTEYLNEFKEKLIIEYLGSMTLSLGQEFKYQTFQCIISLVTEYLLDIIKDDKFGSRYNSRIQKVFKVFEECMNSDEDYRECFKLYEDICTTFVRPIEKFTVKEIQNIRQLIKWLRKVAKKLGFGENGLNVICRSIIFLNDAVLSSWERHQSTMGKDFIFEEDLLLHTMEFIKVEASLLQNFNKDCKCNNSNCQVKKDIYSSVLMNLKNFTISNRLTSGVKSNIPSKIIKTMIKVADNCMESIAELQDLNCACWKKIWTTCGGNIYNLAVVLESNNYEDCSYMYSLLCTSMIHLNALDNSLSFFGNKCPPLSNTLHRLSSLHYQRAKYREAMITSALNSYLYYTVEECKGFRVWVSVKYKFPEAVELTIIDCLKKDKKLIEQIGLPVDLKTVDLSRICFREIEELRDARINLSLSIMKVLDVMETLNSDPILYIRAVNSLGFHILNIGAKISIDKYLEKASVLLKSNKYNSLEVELVESQLMFYKFIEDLGVVEKETEAEMQSAKIKLYATSGKSIPSEPAENVVPAYSQVNISIATSFASKLEKIWKVWENLFMKYSIDKFNRSEITMTLKISITAAEYSKFYRYHSLQTKLWKFSHNLATKLEDNRAIVYITGRSISSQYIKSEWIKQAEEIVATKLDTSKKEQREVIETVAMFKLSLSEYYFQSERSELAEQMFQEATSLPNIDFVSCMGTYLYSLGITLAYRLQTLKNFEQNRQLEYIRFIVKGLYTMLTIDDSTQSGNWSKERCLYELDIVFNFTTYITSEMHNLFGFREITAHLIRRLSNVQKMVNPFRAAECLKCLCFIDLSREQMDDCEVKVQGLEHILKIETFEMSMKTKSTEIKYPNSYPSETNYKPVYCIEPVRDIPYNDTSPILRKKVFVTPEFIHHGKTCKCFKCSNMYYKFLVFSCTHIRAQLYSLQNQQKHASEHFNGAFEMIESIMDYSKDQEYNIQDIIEFVMFLLDFSRHLRKINLDSERGFEMAQQAVEVCKRFKLEGHSIYMAASVLVFEYRCINVNLCTIESPFIIPAINDIDISMYDDLDKKINLVCETPCQTNTRKTKMISPKRKKPVPILTLGNCTIDLAESEEEMSPGPLVSIKPKKKAPVKVRPIRRQISDEDYSEGDENLNTKQRSVRSSKLTPKEENERKINSTSLQSWCDQAWKLAPSTVEKLDILNRKDRTTGPAKIQHIEELIKILAKDKIQQIRCDENQENIQKIDDLMGIMREVIDSKSKLIDVITISSKSLNKSTESSLDSITKNIERMSIKTVKDTDKRKQKHDDLNSEDEIVEPSIIEPRRSRRVLSKNLRAS